LTLSVNPSVGTFSGRYQPPGGGPALKLNGVELQDLDEAFGFFLGTNGESGAVLLQGQ
jgi:hypothetical protein